MGLPQKHVRFLFLIWCITACGTWFSSPAAAQTQIDRIEINQAIGVQKNNGLKFVAGKDTVVRAFLGSPMTIDPAQTRAVIVRDGQPVGDLTGCAA